MLHGFGVEVTDALAEYWHEVMRRELGIARERPADFAGYVVQEYQGQPLRLRLPRLPGPGARTGRCSSCSTRSRIGVTLTENMEMVPEQTTSAIVVHHPQAKYFAV